MLHSINVIIPNFLCLFYVFIATRRNIITIQFTCLRKHVSYPKWVNCCNKEQLCYILRLLCLNGNVAETVNSKTEVNKKLSNQSEQSLSNLRLA